MQEVIGTTSCRQMQVSANALAQQQPLVSITDTDDPCCLAIPLYHRQHDSELDWNSEVENEKHSNYLN